MAYKDKSERIEKVNAYNKDNYDRITVLLPKGYKDKLRKIVGKGGSLTAWIKDAIDTKIREDQGKA